MSKRNVILFAATVTAASICQVSLAAPYAAQITEATGNVSFVLNEDASNVTIILDGVPTSLGALTAGTQTFARGTAANYQIVVDNNSAPGYLKVINNTTGTATGNGATGPVGTVLQIGSSTTNVVQQFEKPRDVAINTNPSTPALFGRTYVSEARSSTSASGRATTAGIYVFNADRTQTLINGVAQGNSGLIGGAGSPGGASAIDQTITTPTNTDSTQLFKISLDAVGNVYVADGQVGSSRNAASPGVRVFNPDITTSADVFVGVDTVAGGDAPVGGSVVGPVVPSSTLNHGHVSAVLVTGSAAAGNLVVRTVDTDIQPTNTVQIYNLGSTPSGFAGLPTAGASLIIPVHGVLPDLETGPTGNFYLSQGRSDGYETGLWVLAPDATTVKYDSFADSKLLGIDGNSVVGPGVPTAATPVIQDVARLIQGTAISPDGKWLAFSTNSGGLEEVVPLYEGIPDLANHILFNPFTSTGTDVEFDAANNLWATNSGNEALRVSSPGGVSHTVYNSNGTFTVINGNEFDGSGSLGDSSKWAFGVVPNGTEDRANIGTLSSGTQTATVDSQTVLASLTFGGGNYTVGGTAPLLFGNDGQFESFLEGRIIVNAGNQTINALVDVRKNFGVVAVTGSSLTLNNVTFANSATTVANVLTPNPGQLTIQKFGGGVVSMPAFTEKLLVVRDGRLRFNSPASAGAANVKSLFIAGTPTAPTASLDLGATGLVVDYDAPVAPAVSPFATLYSLVTSGSAHGLNTGKGIVAFDGIANTRITVGIAEASSLTTIPALFGTVDSTAVLMRTTYKGDTDLSGTVGFNDLLALAQSYAQPGTKLWVNGDSNYDGTVNFDDLLALAQNYNSSFLTQSQVAGEFGASFAADWALAQSLVPEPTSLSLMGLGAAALLRRRRA